MPSNQIRCLQLLDFFFKVKIPQQVVLLNAVEKTDRRRVTNIDDQLVGLIIGVLLINGALNIPLIPKEKLWEFLKSLTSLNVLVLIIIFAS